MAEIDDNQSVASTDRLVDVGNLSYNDFAVDPTGGIMTKEAKLELRQKHGCCTTCTGLPVLLYNIKRNRLNPLWTNKQARSVPGECSNGICLRCQKERHQQQQRASPSLGTSTRVAPVPTIPYMSGSTRQPSNSTLSTDYVSRSNNSADSHRFSVPRNDRLGRHSNRDSSSVIPRRSYSNDDLLSSRTQHGASTTFSTNSTGLSSGIAAATTPYGAGPARGSGSATTAMNRRSRALTDAALRNKATTSDSFHPTTIDEVSCTELPVPTLIPKRPPKREASTSNISTTSSLSNDSRLLDEDCQTDLGHLAVATNTPSEESKVVEQVSLLLKDLGTNPIVMADVLLYAIKSNTDKKHVQIYCLENMQVPAQASSSTGLYRGVFQSMKNHRGCVRVQTASLMILNQWCEDDLFRPILVQHGVCDHIQPLLTQHVGDAAIVEQAVALLRLVTLEERGRTFCQEKKFSIFIVQGMQCHPSNGRIQTDGCAVLSNLAIDTQEKSVAVVPSAILGAVTSVLLRQATLIESDPNTIDWSVVKSACFTIKNFLYRQENQRDLAGRDDLLQSLESLLQIGPRRSKDAVAVLEKLQLTRVQDESLEIEVLGSLQKLWNKPVSQAIDEILRVWEEHAWSTRILLVSMHVIQDMLDNYKDVDPNLIVRTMDASMSLENHEDQRVAKEVANLRGRLISE